MIFFFFLSFFIKSFKQNIMKFKTLKSSETGRKIESIFNRIDVCHESATALSKELHFKEWRSARWVAYGGISSVIFADSVVVDKKYWKEVRHGEFYPKKNTKIGKALSKKFEDLPTIDSWEMNKVIEFDGAPFKTIGLDQNETYYFILADEKWNIKIPVDCEEITVTEYKELTETKGIKL